MSSEATAVNPPRLIVTPGNSVSRLLLARISEQFHKEKHLAWKQPRVLAFNTWVQQLWQMAPMTALDSRPLLLNPIQELAVWEDIITASNWSELLMQTTSLARIAARANRVLAEWHVPAGKLREFSNEESSALHSWVTNFDRRCRESNWVPACRLVDHLVTWPREILDFPREIEIYGFDEITPQQKSLLDCASESGSHVRYVDPGRRSGRAVRVALPDRQREYEMAAAWAKARIQENKSTSIAIALTDKANQLGEIKRALDRTFYPDRLYPSASPERVYDTGESNPLESSPAIDLALLVLGQSRYRVELQEFSEICRSPYISGFDEEIFQRFTLDSTLRSLGELKPSLLYIISRIFDKENESYKIDCPDFHKQLVEWLRCINAVPRSQRPSEWARDFAILLNSIGWPGKYKLDPDMQSTLNRWDDVLSQLCALDAVSRPLRIEEALSWVRRLVANSTIPAPRQAGAIKLVSIDDAASINFDLLWVCGLDDEQWPPRSRPNPLIPIALQREFNIPGASNSEVTKSAVRTLENVLQNADDIVLSHAIRTEDRDLRLSTVILDIKEISASSLPSPGVLAAEALTGSIPLELYRDVAIPLSVKRASGGTSIIRNQAACPFRAFVTHRLQSELPEEPQPGLDASERGTLVHKVLELVWSELKDSRGLKEMEEAVLEKLVRNAAQSAIEKFAWKKPETLTPRFREVELDRIVTLVMRWLQLERARHPFSVLPPEIGRTISMGGLQMNIMIDRIDQNEAGEKIVIDYKTGKTRLSSWFGDRPDEPQLPIYAVCEYQEGQKLAAICFAQIRAAEISFNGISQEKNQLPDVVDWSSQRNAKQFNSWEEILQEWHEVLESLAANFVAGISYVDPKNSSSCMYCDLPGVCRVHELKHRLGFAEEEETGFEE